MLALIDLCLQYICLWRLKEDPPPPPRPPLATTLEKSCAEHFLYIFGASIIVPQKDILNPKVRGNSSSWSFMDRLREKILTFGLRGYVKLF